MTAKHGQNDVPAVERLEDRLLFSAGDPVSLVEIGGECELAEKAAIECSPYGDWDHDGCTDSASIIDNDDPGIAGNSETGRATAILGDGFGNDSVSPTAESWQHLAIAFDGSDVGVADDDVMDTPGIEDDPWGHVVTAPPDRPANRTREPSGLRTSDLSAGRARRTAWTSGQAHAG